MTYKVIYHEKFQKDLTKLKFGREKVERVLDKIDIVAKNPEPKSQGGLGEPLSGDLSGLLKFRFDSDYRIVYKLELVNGQMEVLIIGLRKDKQVYKEAKKRR